MNRNKLSLVLLGLFLIPMSLTACETMRGAGRDVENAGDGIEDFTDDVADEIED